MDSAGRLIVADRHQARIQVFGFEKQFLRGECNDDDKVDVSDALCALNWLFVGTSTPPCIAALNSNADEAVNISDAVWLLNYLFLGGPAPGEPFPECGQGTPEDRALGCETKPVLCQT